MGSEDLTEVLMNVAIFWDIDGHMLAGCFLVRLIFDLEDGGDTYLRNFGSYTD
jgi:hypothetical protein